MNESETRAELIDPALKKAGWGVIEGTRIRREYPISQGRLLGQGRRSTPLSADYVLQYKNRNLAIIEAKSNDKYYTEGLGQAKDYAQRLHIRFAYATNGLQIYQVDRDEGREGDINRFPTPDELWKLTFPPEEIQDKREEQNWKDAFLSIPFEDRGGTWQPRYYQEVAIQKTLEAIANKQTRILLTLATGTGKTAIAFQIAWKLFQTKWNIRWDKQRRPRILFLADRNILADQAFNAFSAFEDDAKIRIRPGDIRKRGNVPKNGSVFFTIFQTFMCGPEDTPFFGQYPRDYFDLVVIDECHRGGANDESRWRAIMEYFSPAVQLGLTATPKRDVNIDTYRYFGKPVYTYSLKEGINDGFLTPFKVEEIKTTIDTYTYTSDDMLIEGEIEEGREYTESDFNRIIEIREREQYRVKLFMDKINQSRKTLVFCSTQRHALAVRDLINQYADSTNPDYCHRVTADDGMIGEQHLRNFQDNERTIPTVLTTSQKLSTGVDAPEVRNIVLLRPINSMVEFKQIIGRGTRLFEGKDYFTIYDFVGAHKHFNDPEWDGPPLNPPESFQAPQPCHVCGKYPCTCPKPEQEPCSVCGNIPCVCEKPSQYMIKVKLSDRKVIELDSMIKTSFWSPDGKPISSEEFVKSLFGDLPKFFKDEEELRRIWSLPGTRKKLIKELADNGYSESQLQDLQKLIHGEDSDLYDVLSYIAWHKDMVPRLDRANRARAFLNSYDQAQQEFLNFVLDQYVRDGIIELDDQNLPDLLTLKYKAIADAREHLGDVATIRETFIGFQGNLYKE